MMMIRVIWSMDVHKRFVSTHFLTSPSYASLSKSSPTIVRWDLWRARFMMMIPSAPSQKWFSLQSFCQGWCLSVYLFGEEDMEHWLLGDVWIHQFLYAADCYLRECGILLHFHILRFLLSCHCAVSLPCPASRLFFQDLCFVSFSIECISRMMLSCGYNLIACREWQTSLCMRSDKIHKLLLAQALT